MSQMDRMEENDSLPGLGSRASDAIELAAVADVWRFLSSVGCSWWGTDTTMWLWGREEMVRQVAVLHRVELYFGEPRLQKKRGRLPLANVKPRRTIARNLSVRGVRAFQIHTPWAEPA